MYHTASTFELYTYVSSSPGKAPHSLLFFGLPSFWHFCWLALSRLQLCPAFRLFSCDFFSNRMIRSSRTRFFMNLPVRFNIAKNTRHYLTPKSLSPKLTVHSKQIKKKGTALSRNSRSVCVLMFISKRSLFDYYFRRSGIRSTLDAFRFILAPLPQPFPGGEPCNMYFCAGDAMILPSRLLYFNTGSMSPNQGYILIIDGNKI